MSDHTARFARGNGVSTPAGSDAGWSGLAPEFVRSVAADRLKALGPHDRLRIVEVLAGGPKNVSELAAATGMPNATVSRHLRVLHDAQVVDCSRRGNFVLYVLDDLLQEVVGAHFEGDSAALTQPFLMAVGEMADNALSHGRGADTGAYVAAQRYEKKRLVMAIGDTGVGIPDHLREQFPHLTNDGEAIEEATKEGVTAARNENRNHRGMGYVHLTEAMTDAKMSSGSVRIWSGCGRYQFSVRNGQVFDREPSVTNERTAGTWVRVELSVSCVPGWLHERSEWMRTRWGQAAA